MDSQWHHQSKLGGKPHPHGDLEPLPTRAGRSNKQTSSASWKDTSSNVEFSRASIEKANKDQVRSVEAYLERPRTLTDTSKVIQQADLVHRLEAYLERPWALSNKRCEPESRPNWQAGITSKETGHNSQWRTCSSFDLRPTLHTLLHGLSVRQTRQPKKQIRSQARRIHQEN